MWKRASLLVDRARLGPPTRNPREGISWMSTVASLPAGQPEIHRLRFRPQRGRDRAILPAGIHRSRFANQSLRFHRQVLCRGGSPFSAEVGSLSNTTNGRFCIPSSPSLSSSPSSSPSPSSLSPHSNRHPWLCRNYRYLEQVRTQSTDSASPFSRNESNKGKSPKKDNRRLNQQQQEHQQNQQTAHRRNNNSNSKKKKKKKKPRQQHSRAAETEAALAALSREECSRILERACSDLRGIALTKRQRYKPWIMALLLHRYDRGIRNPDELHTDSVYWKGTGSSSSSSNGNNRNGSSSSSNNNNNVSHADLVAPDGIDLREVLTPRPDHVRNFLERNGNPSLANDPEAAEEFLRQKKLGLLATEARRIAVDRELLVASTETISRKLSKTDPALFLSRFSRAMAIALDGDGDVDGDGDERGSNSTDFSHRRHHPPSLKKAVYQQAKRREQQQRAEAQRERARAAAANKKGRLSAEVRNKMAAMRRNNR